jgi:CubicO group peptidase (beta-lactamase class C family)
MLNAALALVVAALEPRVERAIAAIGEKDCPNLYGMITESFQKAAPAPTWPRWCASVGQLSEFEDLGPKDGWLRFRAASPHGPTRLDIAFDASGKISGIRANPDDTPSAKPDTTSSLDEKLVEIRNRNHLPALAVLIERPGESTTVSAVGVRKLGDPTPVGVNDKWHLGSDTKAMTATLAALLVEDKKLKWSSTVSEILPDWRDINPAYAQVTLELLLAHRSGLPANVPHETWKKITDPKNTPKERSEAAHAALRLPPANASGVFAYSNAGYVVAGVMIERVTGLTWEVALKKRVFEPLGMASCGFGAPATTGKVDQPWAHRPENNALVAVQPGPESDNPAGMGPAGTVHCSLADWAKFAELHLEAERGEKTALLSPESMSKLHTAPPDGKYALGWGVVERPWAGGKVLTHIGSNTMFYASVWLVPAKNLLFLVATNSGDESAEKAINEVLPYLVERYATRGAVKVTDSRGP